MAIKYNTLRSTSNLIWKAANVIFPPGKHIEERFYKWETPKVTSNCSLTNDVFCNWRMALLRDTTKCFSLAIVIENNEKPFIDANLNISLYSNDNITLIKKFEEQSLKILKNKYGEQILVQQNFMTHSIIQQYYKPQDPENSTLKIVCKADFSLTPEIKEPSKTKLQMKLKHWLDSGKCTDVTFLVDEQNLKAHKVLLMAQSKVFEAMFTSNMTEMDTEQVEVTDISYEILKEVIHYIYTEEIPKLDELAYDLIQAADKYELEDLKLRCEQNLIEDISVENAVLLLILSDRHNARGLKTAVLKFFRQNAQKILQTKECENLMCYPVLQHEILYAMVDVERPVLKTEKSLENCEINIL